MPELLVRLDHALRLHRPTYYARLQPGVSRTVLHRYETTLGMPFPSLFRAFYFWRNGQALDDVEAWQNNQTLMSLASIEIAYTVLTELLDAGDFPLRYWWHPSWIPFLDNGAGDHLCLDLHGAFTGQQGQIIAFWHDDATREIVAPSFEVWLESYLQALGTVEIPQASAGAIRTIEWHPNSPGYPLVYHAE